MNLLKFYGEICMFNKTKKLHIVNPKGEIICENYHIYTKDNLDDYKVLMYSCINKDYDFIMLDI